MCKLLLQSRADPNTQSRVGRVTALHRAAYSGNKYIVSLLLENKANQMLADSDGELPAHKVSIKKYILLILGYTLVGRDDNRHTTLPMRVRHT